jgi:ribosomal protein S27E
MSESTIPDGMNCQKCGRPLAYTIGGKTKLMVKSRVIAFGQDGIGQMVCPHCHNDTAVPSVRFFVAATEVAATPAEKDS